MCSGVTSKTPLQPARRKKAAPVLSGLSILVFAFSAAGRTLLVPTDFATIQTGVDSAQVSDTVLVAPGIYHETVHLNGRDIILGSFFLINGDMAYVDSTVIDGDSSGSVVRYDSGESRASRLAGFTIVHGSGSIDAENDISGGGVHCHDASPRLDHLKIIENTAWYAAGIYCELGANAEISYCLVTNNVAAIAGGGIDAYDADPTILNCTFTGNRAIRGGGLYAYQDCQISLVNCIFWDNSPQEVLYSLSGDSNTTTISYCAIRGGMRQIVTRSNGSVEWGVGNIELAPGFLDPENGDFSLNRESPCIDAGDPSREADPDGTWPDIGFLYHAHEFVEEPRIGVNADLLDFGLIEVDSVGSLTCQIRNIGYSPLIIANITTEGDHRDDFITDFDGSFSIEAGGYGDIRITFRPDSEGVKSASLRIESDDPNRGLRLVGLQGVSISRGERHRWSVPSDFALIQDAIAFSSVGDTVLVSEGIYPESLDFLGKDIVVASEFLLDLQPQHIIQTSLVGDMSWAVVSFVRGEGRGATLEGFRISGGRDGIYFENSSPSINHCLIYDNDAVNSGGGGINCRAGATPQLLNCTIAGNQARWGGGIYGRDGAVITLTNCILWGNAPNPAYFTAAGALNRLQVTYSDVEGGAPAFVTNNNCTVAWGDGNISADPLFNLPDSGDYRLTWPGIPDQAEDRSPCIDTGDPDSPVDMDGSRADMGALPFDQNVLPNIEFSPDELIFSDVPIRTARTAFLAILNVGGLPLRVSNQRLEIIEGPPFFAIAQGGGSFESAAGDTHFTGIVFTPWIAAGYGAILHIESNDRDERESLVSIRGSTLGVTEMTGGIPDKFALTSIQPNPFNNLTTVAFSVPDFRDVRLALTDLVGRAVALPLEERLAPGNYVLPVNGSHLAAGCYLLQLSGGADQSTRKLILAK